MTILNELIEYSNKCINGEIISCKKHKQACIRFLKDLNNSNFVWNEEKAKSIVEWFSYLRHSKGVLAKQPIILTTWQKFVLCQVYGWEMKNTGERRFKRFFIEVGRKNAKSQMEAGVALYEISVKATETGEVREAYCAGVQREQSAIVFKEAQNMLVGSPLRKVFKSTRDKIEHTKTGSFLVPLSKEARRSGDGTNPALLIIDEYHQHPTTELYDLGLGANAKDNILMIITTAGVNLNYPCYQQEYSYCSRVIDPNSDVENDRYFIDILEIDEEDDIKDKTIWEKANPVRMSYKQGIENIETAFKEATDIPEKMPIFLTKCLNKWVQATQNGYMDMQKWKKCVVPKITRDLKNQPVYVGFDMSATTDLTSVSFIVPIQEEVVKYYLYSHSFIPNREKLIERCNTDKVAYDLWEQQGYITITNTPVVDQDQVIAYVEEFCNKKGFKINTLCFDKSHASKLMLDCSKRGHVVEEVWQSYKHLNEATTKFREEVYKGNIIVEKNPVLDFAIYNAVIRENNGLIKIDKEHKKNRIDPVDASLFAFKLAYYHDFNADASLDAFLKFYGI